MLRRTVLVLSFVSAGAVAAADPPDARALVVFAPIPEIHGDREYTDANDRSARDRRLLVADAVHETLTGEGHLAGVRSGLDVFHSLGPLRPDLEACRDGACAAHIAEALNARGVVMVQVLPVEGHRHELRVSIDVFDRHGTGVLQVADSQVVAHSEAGARGDAVALARALTRSNLARLQAADAQLTLASTPAPVAIPGGDLLRLHGEIDPAHLVVASVPPAMVTVYHRRTGEAVAGTLLLLGGAAAVAVGAVDVASYGTVATDAAMTSLRRPQWAPQDYVLFGAGGVALVAGAILLIDGARRHGEQAPATGATPPAVGMVPLGRGAALTLSGRF